MLCVNKSKLNYSYDIYCNVIPTNKKKRISGEEDTLFLLNDLLRKTDIHYQAALSVPHVVDVLPVGSTGVATSSCIEIKLIISIRT